VDAEIDTLEKAHILDVLPAAFADHPAAREFVAVVEQRRQIIGDSRSWR